MDLRKIKIDLGYRDVLPMAQALPHTVRWYIDHQPARGGEIEKNLHDPFNYAAEDRLVTTFRTCLQQLDSSPVQMAPCIIPTPTPNILDTVITGIAERALHAKGCYEIQAGPRPMT
jgi:hypothetical protein